MPKLLPVDRYKEIKLSIVDMFEECKLFRIPINGLEIATLLQYRLIPYSTLSLPERNAAEAESEDGYCEVKLRDDGIYEYVINYNDSAMPERMNWTILHEIGHIYLGHLDDNKKAPAVEEAEANFFAKYAIAPPPLVNELRCSCPEDIQKKFHTSWTAACNCYAYYQKWKQYGPIDYELFERRLIRMFSDLRVAM